MQEKLKALTDEDLLVWMLWLHAHDHVTPRHPKYLAAVKSSEVEWGRRRDEKAAAREAEAEAKLTAKQKR